MGCVRGVLSRPHPLKPGVTQIFHPGCHKLRCLRCGPIKASAYRAAVYVLAQRHKLQRLVTLTLDPWLIPPNTDSVTYINQVFARFRTKLSERRGLKLTYVRVLEFQRNGTAHLHLLIHETVAQDTLLQAWRTSGGGHQVRIRFRDGNSGASYVTKYLTKDLCAAVPPGRRVITTDRGMLLFPAKLPSGWQWHNWDFGVLVSFLSYQLLETSLGDLDPRYMETCGDLPWEIPLPAFAFS